MNSNNRLISTLFSIVLLSISACGGGGGGSDSTTTPPPPVNKAPTANAGDDQTATGGSQVSLAGSGTDGDGTIQSVEWIQLSGDPITINNANANDVSITLPAVNSDTDFDFQFTVTDDDGATASDTVVVTATANLQALLGPISGATVELYSLNDLATPIFTTNTNQTTTSLSEAGNFSLDLSSAADTDWLLVKVTGGSDIDADDDGVVDATATVNTGSIYALATKADLAAGAKINLLTTLAWKATESNVQAGDIDSLAEDMQWAVTSLLSDDINGDSLLDYKDLLNFVPTDSTQLSLTATDYPRYFETNSNGVSLIGAIHSNSLADFDERVASLFPEGLAQPVIPGKIAFTTNLIIPTNRNGIAASDAVIHGFVSDTAELINGNSINMVTAEDSDGKTLLLGYALPPVAVAKSTNQKMKVAGSYSYKAAKMMAIDNVELSTQSTAAALVKFSMGSTNELDDIDVMARILAHPDFTELNSAIDSAFRSDAYFLEKLTEYPYISDLVAKIGRSVLDGYVAEIQADIDANIQPQKSKNTKNTVTKNVSMTATAITPTQESFWWGSPWDKHEDWLWYQWDTGVLDPPFVADSIQGSFDNSLFAIGNSAHINYILEMYDDQGNKITGADGDNWYLMSRNSTLIQKVKNSGAAQTLIWSNKVFKNKPAHIELNRYFYHGWTDRPHYAAKAFHIIHLGTGVLAVIGDASFINLYSKQAERLLSGAATSATLRVDIATCGEDLVSTVDFNSENIASFFAENGFSLVETAITGCVFPIAERLGGDGAKNAINTLFIKLFPKVAAKFSNVAGWAVILFDAANDLAPNATYLFAGDSMVGYDLTWGTDGALLTVSENAARPQPNSTPAIILPVAKFSHTHNTALDYNFDSSASSFDSTANPSYSWDFGDGSTSTDASPAHTFAAVGTYKVSLTINDGLGNSAIYSLNINAQNGFAPQITDIYCQVDVNNPLKVFTAITASDADNDISEVRWFLASSDVVPALVNNYASVNSATLTYPNDGVSSFSPYVVIVDGAGNTDRKVCESIVTGGNSDLSRGLVAYYPFDGNANDASGNGNDGVENGGVVYGTGVKNEALDLNGQFIQVNDTGTYFDNSTEFSVSLWTKPDGSGQGTMFSQRFAALNDWQTQFGIWRGTDNKPYLRVYGIDAEGTYTSGTARSAETMTDTTHWYHIVGVYDGTQVQLFVDGVLAASLGYSDPVRTVPGAYSHIGINANTQNWYGNIDEINIYNRALNANEVLTLFNDNRP